MRTVSATFDLPDSSLSTAVTLVVLGLAALAIAVLPLTMAVAAFLGTVAFTLTLLRPELGIYMAILSVPFGSLREVSIGSASVTATEFIVPIVFFSWVMRMIAQREARIRFTPIFPFAVLFLGVLVLSATIAPSLSLSGKELLKWGEFLLLYLVVVNVMATRRQIALVVAVLLLATSMEALYGWFQFLLRKGPEGFLIGGRFLRAFGTFGQPNPYAGYLGLTLPLVLGLLIGAKWDMTLRIDWGFAVLVGASTIILAAMLMSLSRGAWLGLAVATAFMLSVRSRKSFILLLAGSVVATMVALLGALDLLPAQLAERLSSAVEYFGVFDVRQITLTPENWAIVERMAYWQSAWEMFLDHPVLGIGIGNFIVFYPDYAFPDWALGAQGHAHNYYLNILAEAGVLGLAAYMVLLLGIFFFAVRVLRAAADRPAESPKTWEWLAQPYPLALGIIGVFLQLSVHNFFDVLYVHGMAAQFGIILGLLAATHLVQVREGA